MFFFFRSHTCSYFWCLNDFVWFLNLSLKGPPVLPIYVLVCAFRLLDRTVIMGLDDVLHATVADFDCVFVEDFMKLVSSREVLCD